MAQDRSAHDRQIRIGTDEIMRELLHEIKQLAECIMLDLHRNMLCVKYDAVLVVIYIRGILESPAAPVDHHRNHPVILSRRMIDAPRVTLVLHTQQAFRVTALLRGLGRCNGLGVLLRLGQVNGNIQIAVFGRRDPFLILPDTVSSDIVRILAQFVEIFRSFFGTLPVPGLEFGDHLTRPWHQHTHDLRIKQIPVYDAVLRHDALLIGIIHHGRQYLFQLVYAHAGLFFPVLQLIQMKQLQQPVGRIDLIRLRDQSRLQSVLYQFSNIFLYHVAPHFCTLPALSVSVPL